MPKKLFTIQYFCLAASRVRFTNKAFTLIEFITVILLLGIIAGIGVPLMIGVSESWMVATEGNEMSESAKVAMERMVREIRRIQDRTSIIVANSGVFSFTDLDGKVITFDTAGTILRRTLDATIGQLADNVSSLTFTYYDKDGSVITAPIVNPNKTDLRRIKIVLTFSLGSTQLSFSSQISPRRLQ